MIAVSSAHRRGVGFSILLGLTLLGLAAGCSGAGRKFPEGSFERGEAEYQKERWYEAVEDLRLFIRRAPTDPRAAEAQFMIGMARYEDEDYPVAAVEFEILRNDYPTSDLAEEGWYWQGMSYVEQVPRIDLDQTTTRQAVEHFTRYLREYPGGRFRPEVEDELASLKRHLDRKELEAARLYRDLGRWQAAAVTIDALLETRPDSELRSDMLLLSGEVHWRRAEWAQAREAWQSFLRDYPDDSRVRDAQRGLERIDGKASGEDS